MPKPLALLTAEAQAGQSAMEVDPTDPAAVADVATSSQVSRDYLHSRLTAVASAAGVTWFS